REEPQLPARRPVLSAANTKPGTTGSRAGNGGPGCLQAGTIRSWQPSKAQLITLIMEPLMSRGLIYSFCSDCLAKVDNFGWTHLDKQEWNPAMNKNQFRNWLRQSLVLSREAGSSSRQDYCSGGGPKTNHLFRPQIEGAIHEFQAAQKKESVPAPRPEPESQDLPAPSQDIFLRIFLAPFENSI
uniref:Uncharacterized protein n=1 Tax=Marmota marmota marmota TaxID=9994 RepID=A0A8C5YVN8_MARMA